MEETTKPIEEMMVMELRRLRNNIMSDIDAVIKKYAQNDVAIDVRSEVNSIATNQGVYIKRVDHKIKVTFPLLIDEILDCER